MERSPTVESERIWHNLFARWLREIRDDRQLSQEAVAFAAGVDVSTYRRIEHRASGRSKWVNPRLDTALKIMIALRVASGELYGYMQRVAAIDDEA